MGNRYTKDQLRAALDGATSWSAVNVRLGRVPDARTDTLRALAATYELDTSGIVNPNAGVSYTDEQLAEAIPRARSWADAAEALGKSRRAGGAIKGMRARALRLGLDLSHLDKPRGKNPQ